jgi:hypothetical protein
MRTRHKVPEVGKEPPESALEDPAEEDIGQEDEGEQLVISVQHDVDDPNTIVLVIELKKNKLLGEKRSLVY